MDVYLCTIGYACINNPEQEEDAKDVELAISATLGWALGRGRKIPLDTAVDCIILSLHMGN